ncbi:MAG: exodeoxyribonuclease III [Xanthomonadaceae bacterium]|nr:exodeoxyribonuclease III [Xanthomonadaceae bacterium]MDP2185614.1 exodeoxyribonuclease III [Xanthomonadales bacterium]MDZ4117348.1 exodeoxyribonuclease III [Xanthomonadaceae bacterium]MDZ4378272.1 exodeoxyribonuclease III [Xanthomonadaceae bacterium]
MKIASWNVNSLKVRLPHLQQWLGQCQPDIVALQETKLEDHKFPDSELAELGYRSVFAGQKTYNGVAIISRSPASEVQVGIPGYADAQKRVLAATIDGLRIVNLYVVNGKAVGDEKYDYKLAWLDALHQWLAQELVRYPNMVVLGDFNIAPDDRDVHDPAAWKDQILCSDAERGALKSLLALGLHDSFRLHHDDAGQFSWWDYRAAGFRRNLGLRIDLVLLSDALKARCVGAEIDREPRSWERPSDHAPVRVELQ